MRVLVVEDDELFGSAVHKALTRSGYAVDWVRRGRDLVLAMQTHRYDCVVLDLGLPDLNGESLVSVVRTHDPGIPVVVATARGGVQDRIRLLDVGADDYMVKPVDLDELNARLRAVSRRFAPQQGTEGELAHGPLRMYPSHQSATWNGTAVPLTKKEYWLLETFVRKKSQVLSRSQLEEALYGWGEEVGSNAVEVYVHYLRRKFRPQLVLTVRGIGYRLGPEDSLH